MTSPTLNQILISPFPLIVTAQKHLKSRNQPLYRLSLKGEAAFGAVALIWSWVQFDFCLAVIGLTLTSPLGRPMKLVIHLRKGQCQTQPIAKYNAPPVIHEIWKAGSPLTFGLFEMGNLCQVTRLNPYTSWEMCVGYMSGESSDFQCHYCRDASEQGSCPVFQMRYSNQQCSEFRAEFSVIKSENLLFRGVFWRKLGWGIGLPTGFRKGQRTRPVCQNRGAD